MSIVALVRHGRTTWNRTRFLGRSDLPLDAVGQGQAVEAACAVAGLAAGWDGAVTVWSSPLRRARSTARPIARFLGVPVQVHDGLAELDCGAWEGREKAEVGLKVSKLPPEQPVPGGESALDVWLRLHGFLTDAGLARTGHPPTVLVGHHLTNKLLRAALLGLPVEQALASPAYRPVPGSVVVLERETGRAAAVAEVTG